MLMEIYRNLFPGQAAENDIMMNSGSIWKGNGANIAAGMAA